MLNIFSFQGWRGGHVEQSGFDKSASGRHGHRGPSLTTVGDGDISEVAGHTLPASFSFLQQTKSQMGIFFFFNNLDQEVGSLPPFEKRRNNPS